MWPGPQQVLWAHRFLLWGFQLEARGFPLGFLCSCRLPHFTLLIAHRLLGKKKAGLWCGPALSWGIEALTATVCSDPNPACIGLSSSHCPTHRLVLGFSFSQSTLGHEQSSPVQKAWSPPVPAAVARTSSDASKGGQVSSDSLGLHLFIGTTLTPQNATWTKRDPGTLVSESHSERLHLHPTGVGRGRAGTLVFTDSGTTKA